MKTIPANNKKSPWLPLALALAVNAAVPLAFAAEAIHISAQPLGQALSELGQQTSLQVFFSPDLVAGKQAPAVDGDISPEQALRQLLQGSGLDYQINEGSVTLSPAATSAATNGPLELGVTDIKVVGDWLGDANAAVVQNHPGARTVIRREAMVEQGAMNVSDVLKRVPGGHIIFDVKCSQRLAPAITEAGGVPLIYKTGHSLIKAKMRAIEASGAQAPLGGEMSGHIFFKERWFGFDDGSYAGARMLEILSQSPDASAVLNALPTSHSTPELNVLCAEGEPHRLVAQLVSAARFEAPASVSTIDGLRVDWPDGFGLIRASNTTPVLVLRFEGQTDAALVRIQTEMLALLRRAKPDAVLGAGAH